MDHLVHVPKQTAMGGGNAKGRPRRVSFALRSYDGGELVHLAIPPHLVEADERADFYISKSGFAVLISYNGDRSITKSNKGRSTVVPLEVRSLMTLPAGTTEITVVENREDKMFFFPFSQFIK